MTTPVDFVASAMAICPVRAFRRTAMLPATLACIMFVLSDELRMCVVALGGTPRKAYCVPVTAGGSPARALLAVDDCYREVSFDDNGTDTWVRAT